MLTLREYGLRVERIEVQFDHKPRARMGTGTSGAMHMLTLSVEIASTNPRHQRMGILKAQVQVPLRDDIAIALNMLVEQSEAAILNDLMEQAARHFTIKLEDKSRGHSILPPC